MSDSTIRKEGRPKRKTVNIGTGSPACLLLDQWGHLVELALGETPYQVGSSIVGKKWRDVDVRVIMDDEQFDSLFGKAPHPSMTPFWNALCTAFSLWGQSFTGLPIDFQIQRRSRVTQSDWDKARSPLGVATFGVINRERPPWNRWHKEETEPRNNDSNVG